MTFGDRKYDRRYAERVAEERRQAEMARGQQRLAKRALSARFNPDHERDTIPDHEVGAPTVSKLERARRDEYRNRMGAQVLK